MLVLTRRIGQSLVIGDNIVLRVLEVNGDVVRLGRGVWRWLTLLASYRDTCPDLATEIDQMQRRELPVGWDRELPVFPADAKGIAGREASGKVINVLAQSIPWFLGGSADLGPSNKTTLT